jgi:methylated-DNA-[protein]-cysteine S-methyltransferase
MKHSYVDSPLGPLLLTGTTGPTPAAAGSGSTRRPGAAALSGIYPPEHVRLPAAPGDRDDSAFAQVREELAEYFAGQRTGFDVELAMPGTEFQRAVWHGLIEIPFGRTVTYGELAERIGRPAAVRAVGLANGRNPVSIVVPCHRVVGSTGALTGYAGGIEAKAWLLDFERAVLDRQVTRLEVGMPSR